MISELFMYVKYGCHVWHVILTLFYTFYPPGKEVLISVHCFEGAHLSWPYFDILSYSLFVFTHNTTPVRRTAAQERSRVVPTVIALCRCKVMNNGLLHCIIVRSVCGIPSPDFVCGPNCQLRCQKTTHQRHRFSSGTSVWFIRSPDRQCDVDNITGCLIVKGAFNSKAKPIIFVNARVSQVSAPAQWGIVSIDIRYQWIESTVVGLSRSICAMHNVIVVVPCLSSIVWWKCWSS